MNYYKDLSLNPAWNIALIWMYKFFARKEGVRQYGEEGESLEKDNRPLNVP